MLMVNRSKLTQVLDVPTSIFPVAVAPGMVVESTAFKYLPEYAFVKFNTDMFKNLNNVYLLRNYALGDLIQLIAVARYFKKYYNIKNVWITTTDEYCMKLRNIYRDIRFNTESSAVTFTNNDICFNLNGCLEKDHSLSNDENQLHRVEIYLNILGIHGINKEDLDWNPTHLSKDVVSYMDTKRKKIGIQIRGSGMLKTLNYELVKRISHKLAEKYTVVLLDADASKGFEGTNIINTCGKLDTYQVIATLMQLDCCITMDSGMLWMAHSANCPVLVILGPTREEERVSLHPQYPEKAKSISIAEMIGCKPCFETQKFCERKINCMRSFNEDELISKIQTKIESIVGE